MAKRKVRAKPEPAWQPPPVRPMGVVPLWFRRHIGLWGCNRCIGWVRLSRSSLLLLCRSGDHLPRDGRSGSRRGLRGRIYKKFQGDVRHYDLKKWRAKKLQRPLVDYWYRRRLDHGSYAWPTERQDFKLHPLTEREWMLATALLYFLE
jgi:hypothetical protein